MKGDGVLPNRRGTMGQVPNQISKFVKERDGGCVVCDKSEEDGVKLVCHHKTPEEEGGETTLSNLVTLCKTHHQMIHRRSTPSDGLPKIDADQYDISLSSVDQDIIGAISRDGPSSTRRIARITGSSEYHVHRRLHRLMAEGILDRGTEDKLWDFDENISSEESIRGEWPDKPYIAGVIGRGDVMRRLVNAGWDFDEIAELVGIGQRAVRDSVTRARALEPPFEDRSNSGKSPRQAEDQLTNQGSL